MLREMGRNWRAAGALDHTDRATKPAERSDSAPADHVFG